MSDERPSETLEQDDGAPRGATAAPHGGRNAPRRRTERGVDAGRSDAGRPDVVESGSGRAAAAAATAETTADDTPRIAISGRAVRIGDRVFTGLSTLASAGLLLIILAIAVFLLIRAIPALQANTANFLTETDWFPDSDPSVFGIAALAWGTLLSSVLALLLAVPVAIGTSLFITHYAPRRVAQVLGYLVDLLAAVPSVIYGLWGLYFLVPNMVGLSQWLADHLGWVPLFDVGSGSTFRQTMFNAAVVLAVMILPIISAVCREIFLQAPRTQIEGALALGATRWEMIRIAVLPFGRSGIVSASMLGLGRALGETVAIALVLSTNYVVSLQVLNPGGNTFAANIALQYGFAGTNGINALIASGLVLFVITLLVNMAARLIVARRREFSAAAA